MASEIRVVQHEESNKTITDCGTLRVTSLYTASILLAGIFFID